MSAGPIEVIGYFFSTANICKDRLGLPTIIGRFDIARCMPRVNWHGLCLFSVIHFCTHNTCLGLDGVV